MSFFTPPGREYKRGPIPSCITTGMTPDGRAMVTCKPLPVKHLDGMILANIYSSGFLAVCFVVIVVFAHRFAFPLAPLALVLGGYSLTHYLRAHKMTTNLAFVITDDEWTLVSVGLSRRTFPRARLLELHERSLPHQTPDELDPADAPSFLSVSVLGEGPVRVRLDSDYWNPLDLQYVRSSLSTPFAELRPPTPPSV